MYSTRYAKVRLALGAVAALLLAGALSWQEDFTAPAEPAPAGEEPGERPYEVVLAARGPERTPTVDFDNLEGWRLEGGQGGEGRLMGSVAQRIWDSPVARLVYRGTSKESRVVLRPPRPVSIPRDADAVTLWMYGNNWGWSPDETTPPVTVFLLIEKSGGDIEALEMARVRWKEWWMPHRVIAREIQEEGPLQLTGIEVKECANLEERELYFENLTFFRETFEPLEFESRPRRGITLFEGQDPGANRGPGILPFPTRDETILPENSTDEYRTEILQGENGRTRLIYNGDDLVIEFCLQPGEKFWGPVNVKMNRIPVANVLVDAGPTFEDAVERIELVETRLDEDGRAARAAWDVTLPGGVSRVESTLRLWQKSLIVDFVCRDRRASGLSYGRITDATEPSLISIPFLNYGGHLLQVLMAGDAKPFFASIWMDWYLSNSSEPYAVDEVRDDGVWLNGGVRYIPTTDGARNPLFERLFVTLSPLFEETLPTIPNPPARKGKEAGSRLWQESWGPRDYEAEMEKSRRVRAYGIEQLTQCNHEITWRDEGESFTFRTLAAPGKGGDQALKDYVKHQKSLGWRSGLYTNYTDFAPVNQNWDTDRVMRKSNGDLVRAWYRCYSPKALFAVEADRRLAPYIHAKYGSNAAYTDVHTSVAPWNRTDYDARVPGAGTFAATFYAYGELLLHDQQVYDGFCWSEGHHQWLYAGLATGNYALTYTDLKYRDYPFLPQFDLLKMHPLTVDIGMPWTARFFRDDEGWKKPENIVSSIDQFLATTLAYGHIGWLVEEEHGIRQTARSYYMMQQLQSRYAMEKPSEIAYGSDRGLISTSQALQSGVWKRSRLYVRYQNGLELWVNGDRTPWKVTAGGETQELPSFGWLALQEGGFFEASHLSGGSRRDVVGSPAYLFLDGRDSPQRFQGIGTSGAVAVRARPGFDGLSVIAVDGTPGFSLSAPQGDFAWDDVRTHLRRVAEADRIEVKGFDAEGIESGPVEANRVAGGWSIETAPGVILYEVVIPPLRQIPLE